ncbi:hypothetical protein DL771_008729 [Monosporascus sp. 5C6A]|nr:hypothetical protein DL771_008729 [Monosporascus sp. 5C6A]
MSTLNLSSSAPRVDSINPLSTDAHDDVVEICVDSVFGRQRGRNARRQLGPRGHQAELDHPDHGVKDTDAAGQPVNSDGLSFLFPGDGHDTLPDENDIRDGATLLTPLHTDHFSVMKMPHHGSRRSEDRAFYLAYTADLYLR